MTMTEEKKFAGSKITIEKWTELKRYALKEGIHLNVALERAITDLITKPVKQTKKKKVKQK